MDNIHMDPTQICQTHIKFRIITTWILLKYVSHIKYYDNTPIAPTQNMSSIYQVSGNYSAPTQFHANACSLNILAKSKIRSSFIKSSIPVTRY